MIDKLSPNDCCGCAVCYDACPVKAISMETDLEGFRHPHIDADVCINCNLCERMCPIMQVEYVRKAEFNMPRCYAVNHKSYEIRFKSTSGGLFSALAMQMYREGGYVGGAIETPNGPMHIISNDSGDLEKLRRSKYTPSDARGFYSEVKRLMHQGEKALVVGTPCMIAGLRQFLRKDYDNLILVDFVCNSLNSPILMQAAVDYEARQMGSSVTRAITKSKEKTWKGMTFMYDFANGKSAYRVGFGEGNMACHLYHTHIGSRPSCTHCPFKGFPRYSDITMGDYWGCEKHHPALDDDIGTSLVLVNSNKGAEAFNKIKNHLICEESQLSWAIEGNPALIQSTVEQGIDRKAFFEELNAGKPVETLLKKYVKNENGVKESSHIILRSLKKIKRLLNQIYHIIRKAKYHNRYYPNRWYRFIKLNFWTPEIQSNWKKGALIYCSRYAIVEIQQGGKLILNGPLTLGLSKVRDSTMETRLLIEGNATMSINGSFWVGYGSDIEVFSNGRLEIENGGANCNLTLICAKHISMSGHVSIGRDVSIRDTNAHAIALEGYKIVAPVIIEDHTWLGSGCNLNPGVHVGAGSIIGGMANLSCRVPAHSLAIGNPAKVVMKDIMWKY